MQVEDADGHSKTNETRRQQTREAVSIGSPGRSCKQQMRPRGPREESKKTRNEAEQSLDKHEHLVIKMRFSLADNSVRG